MGITGEANYGTDSLDSPWNWEAQTCFTTNIGAGAIGRLSANFGIKLDTKWGKIEGDPGFEYRGQWPTDDEMNSPGRHYAWYNIVGEEICTIKTVTSATGRVWMDRNLGASRVATSMTDTQAYGDLYQWGRGKDGHEKRTSGTTTTLSSTDNPGHGNFITAAAMPYDWRSSKNDNLWQGVSGTNNPCPTGFRVPTADEWQEEMNSWSSKNATGAFASPLKIVAPGSRSEIDGTIIGQGVNGIYWTSTSSDFTNFSYSNALYFTNNDVYLNDIILRAAGGAVRCIKDDAGPVPTVTSTATGRVWMDSNLGAAQVAPIVKGSSVAGEISTTSADTYGDLYQWGRGKDGHEKRTSGTTTTLSSSDVPGHGNFIISSDDWRSPQNDNLWQGVNGVNNPCPTGFRLPTAAELEAELNSWSSKNAAGAAASPLKLIPAGFRVHSSGYVLSGIGAYRSSTAPAGAAWYLYFDNNQATMANLYRASGTSIRCIKD